MFNDDSNLDTDAVILGVDVDFDNGFICKINHYRKNIISGKCIDLIPYSTQYAEYVVGLRNIPSSRFFLNQQFTSTLATQQCWYDNYLKTDNDIFWVICDKTGRTVGINRLYDITHEGAQKGSLIVEEQFSKVLPIALEADLLLIKLAFYKLNLNYITTIVRNENPKMISMNSRIGFQKTDSMYVREVEYGCYKLDKCNFIPTKLESIVNHWGARNELRQA